MPHTITVVRSQFSDRLPANDDGIEMLYRGHAKRHWLMNLPFAQRFFLRFHMTLMLGGIIGASIACNKVLLRHGIDSMFFRYPLNVVAAYSTFFLLVRLWLFYVRSHYGSEITQPDFGSFREARDPGHSRGSWLKHIDSFDPGILDNCGCAFFFLSAAVVALVAGAFLFVVEAPIILTEVAASFFLAGSLLGPARRVVGPHWTGSIFRQTWTRFALALIFALLLALAARVACPQSHTMVEVFKSCL